MDISVGRVRKVFLSHFAKPKTQSQAIWNTYVGWEVIWNLVEVATLGAGSKRGDV